uniref:Uncharacterized protein n=1 Tax=Rhizophagus irregularis (strain DAOM 181602 / DAOM 197198 / MUCL 43194) TaxID=747089 RepID=U9U830_RHIID
MPNSLLPINTQDCQHLIFMFSVISKFLIQYNFFNDWPKFSSTYINIKKYACQDNAV